VFGLWILFDSALGWRSVALVVITVAAAVALPAAIAVPTCGSQTSHRGRTRASSDEPWPYDEPSPDVV
jgi:hypothetical protein